MTSYRVRSAVRWSVGRVTVTLADGTGKVRTLGYPEAAVWDLVSRGYRFPKVVSMMTHIASLDETATRALVCSTLEDWAESGFLERV